MKRLLVIGTLLASTIVTPAAHAVTRCEGLPGGTIVGVGPVDVTYPKIEVCVAVGEVPEVFADGWYIWFFGPGDVEATVTVGTLTYTVPAHVDDVCLLGPIYDSRCLVRQGG